MEALVDINSLQDHDHGNDSSAVNDKFEELLKEIRPAHHAAAATAPLKPKVGSSVPRSSLWNEVDGLKNSVNDSATASGLVISKVWSASITDFENGLLVEDKQKHTQGHASMWRRFALRRRTKGTIVGITSQWAATERKRNVELACQMQKPKRTYQRLRASRKMRDSATLSLNVILPEDDEPNLSPLGPVLECAAGSEPGKDLCLNLSFPVTSSFTFEELQTLVLLNLHNNEETGIDGNDKGTPFHQPAGNSTLRQRRPEPRRGPLICGVCGQHCENAILWKIHRVAHEPKQCESCHLIFATGRGLLTHLKTCRSDFVKSSRFSKLYAGYQSLPTQQHITNSNDDGRRDAFPSMGRRWQPGQVWLNTWPSVDVT